MVAYWVCIVWSEFWNFFTGFASGCDRSIKLYRHIANIRHAILSLYAFKINPENWKCKGCFCQTYVPKFPYLWPIPSPCFYWLQMGIINSHCQLVDPESVRAELRHLKSLNVDGVVVDCWWGIVEAWTPRKYEWSGYRDLFGIIKEFKLKVQVRQTFLNLPCIISSHFEVYMEI